RQDRPQSADVVSERDAWGCLKIAVGALRELEFFLNEATQVECSLASFDLIAIHDARGSSPGDRVSERLAVREQLSHLDLDEEVAVELRGAPVALGLREGRALGALVSALGTILNALGSSASERDEDERECDPPRHEATLSAPLGRRQI